MIETPHAGPSLMGQFGDKFRKARERKEISFDDVSNVIKISPRMLRAIEEENFDQLPGGVFNKGFIRSYAKHIGLDPEESVTEYLDLMREQQIQAQQAWQPPAPVEPPPKPASTKSKAPRRSAPQAQAPVQVEELPQLQLPRAEHIRAGRKEFLARSSAEVPWKIVAVAIVVVILGIVLFWIRYSHHQRSQAANLSVPQSQPNNQTATPAPAAVTPSVPNAGAIPPDSAATQPATAVPAAQTADEEKSDVTIRNFGQPLPKAVKSADKPSGALMLTVRATENSWISITADGQPVTEETLIAPAHPTFRASQNFVVKVGNAAAVTFLWNGQEIPAQGGEGEVKTLVFDAGGMRPASPSQPVPNQ